MQSLKFFLKACGAHPNELPQAVSVSFADLVLLQGFQLPGTASLLILINLL